MDSPSSPIILYLGDDNDDYEDSGNNGNPNRQYSHVETSLFSTKVSSSTDMNNQYKKRKLTTTTNVRVNPSVVNWSKRQRNNQYQQQSPRDFVASSPDSDPIILDPNDYIIEEPDPPQYCSFDWTLQLQPKSTPTISRTPSSSQSNPTSPRISTIPNSPVRKIVPRSIDRPDNILTKNPISRSIQQQRQPIAVPVPQSSQSNVPLHLPKPTASLSRQNIQQRGRPVKNSRIPYTHSTSPPSPVLRSALPPLLPQPPKPSRPLSTSSSTSSSSLSCTTAKATSSSTNPTSTATPRQILNGTGLFSAFHDSKYYQCNICKFKSVTSSTLLQHLFTHMFFCDQCPFYTYSNYSLSQHVFEKHIVTLVDNSNEDSNPKSFDLLYVTRCADGTFALCMDSSPNATNQQSNSNDQRRIISSATFDNEQHQNKLTKKTATKSTETSRDDDNDVVVLLEKSNKSQRTLIPSKEKGKQNQTYVLMKHRKCYLMKKTLRLHSLTLEYNICRENTIRQMCHTQNILKRRKFLTKSHKIRFIDEISTCLRTIVNHIVNSEDNSNPTSPICTLPNSVLSSILSVDNLDTITDSLRLNNKYQEHREQNELYDKEHMLRENNKNTYVLSSPERNCNDQSIISSLHSSLTNGASIFTQTKLNNSSNVNDNTHRFSKRISNTSSLQSNNSKVQKKSTVNSVIPRKQLPLRPVLPKPPSFVISTRPSVSPIIDRNNNSVTSVKPKISATKKSSIIILD